MKADRKLYLTKDGRVVEKDNPAKAKVLVGINGEISAADVKKYGLKSSGGKVVIGNDEPQAEETEDAPKVKRIMEAAPQKPKSRK